MAKAGEPRLRALSAGFGAYFVLMVLLAYLVAPAVAAYVDPGATFWILTAYVILAALGLLGVCLAAMRRAMRLDERLDALEDLQRRGRAARSTTSDGPEYDVENGAPSDLPTDEDVDRLLVDLRRIGEEAVAKAWRTGESEAPAHGAAEEAARLREARGREVHRLIWVREAMATAAAGPAVASLAILGVCAALLPAADGMLLANLRFNAFLGLAGLGGLVGVAAYAAAVFRHIGHHAR